MFLISEKFIWKFINLQMIYIDNNNDFVLTINNKSMFCPTQQVVIAIDKVRPLCKLSCKNDRTMISERL